MNNIGKNLEKETIRIQDHLERFDSLTSSIEERVLGINNLLDRFKGRDDEVGPAPIKETRNDADVFTRFEGYLNKLSSLDRDLSVIFNRLNNIV